MIKAKDPEFKIQADFVQQVRLFYPDLLFTISPAGFIMSAGMGMKMMRLGYTKGTPDVLIFEPRGPYHGFLFEFKAPGGKISPEQVDFMSRARKCGYAVAVVYETTFACALLAGYLKLAIPPANNIPECPSPMLE